MAKNPLQILQQRIPKPLRSRYVIVTILFLVWIVFFDKHDVFTQWHLSKTKVKLEAENEYFEKKIGEVRQDRMDLDQDVEKFAREKYFMKRSNEEVFVIVEESNK